MIEINGAKIFTDDIEDEAKIQIENITNSIAFRGSKIRIQPDVHAGAGTVIGFTAQLPSCGPYKIIPNVIGVDIGCGIYGRKLDINRNDLTDSILVELDHKFREYIPIGFNVHDNPDVSFPDGQGLFTRLLNRIRLTCDRIGLDVDKVRRSLQSLGGGNHFVELGYSKDDQVWITVHSGSRNFGKCVADYYQKLAAETCDVENKQLAYLEHPNTTDYFTDMRVAQDFAALNRRCILGGVYRALLETLHRDYIMDYSFCNIDSVHNYLDTGTMIIRKGATDASLGRLFFVPLNMRDGTLLCKGVGNDDWNCSGPHGAGRIMSRNQAKKNISLDDYKKSMEGIFSTSICAETLDESPFAYKDSSLVENLIKDTATVIDRIKPIYNLKAS